MYIVKNLNTEHKDLIHDIAYDYYGRRIATSSSDQIIKIWDKNDDGEWICSNTIKSHYGSVWKIDWAHPEFGQIIATCSLDRTAVVFEESIGESSVQGVQNTWFRRATLVDSRSSVTDAKFAPKILGLQLATCSTDGLVRIYEAPDVMNLCHWPLIHEIQTKLSSCSCLSWSPTPSSLHAPMIAVGSNDQGSPVGKVILFEFSEIQRMWNKVESISSIQEPVNDVSFAPNLGRSYHLLAIATKNLKILTVKPIEKNPGSFSTYEIREAAKFEDHGSTVWRVSWNVTGTILASSGDDGLVRLWKANYSDVWKCIGTLKGEETIIADGIGKSMTEQNSSSKNDENLSTKKNATYMYLSNTASVMPRH